MGILDDAEKQNPLREHISPEGVEEKIVLEARFMLTQTQGGKYRLYTLNVTSRKMVPHALLDGDKTAEAVFAFASVMKIIAESLLNPGSSVIQEILKLRDKLK